MVMLAGAHNLGFIARRRPDEFLDWWCERLSASASSPPSARFVDQRWIDLVPGLFRTHIVRDAIFVSRRRLLEPPAPISHLGW